MGVHFAAFGGLITPVPKNDKTPLNRARVKMGRSGKRRYKNQPRQDHQNPAEGHQQPTGHQPFELRTSKTPPIHITANDDEWHTEQRGQWKRQETLQGHSNWITGIASAVGVVGLVILYFTLKSTQQSADTASTNLEVSQRAWIFIQPSVIQPLQANTVPNIQYDIHNTGKLPATILHHTVCFAPLSIDESAPMLECKGEGPQWSVVFPDAGGKPVANSNHLARQITEEDIVALKACTEELYLWDEIHYTDKLGGTHLTRQCWRSCIGRPLSLTSPVAFESCPQPDSQYAD